MTPRKLALERLEGRALLAVYTVDFAGGYHPTLTSFHEALNAANATPEADVIEFAPSLAGSSITFDLIPNASTSVVYDLEIRGLGSDQLTFTPSQFADSLGFLVSPSVSHFTISGAMFAPRAAPNITKFASIVRGSTGELRLEDVVATGLKHDALIAEAGSVTLVNTRLVADTLSTSNGYGVRAWSGDVPVRLEGSEISGFKIGAIRATGDVTIVDSTISNNAGTSSVAAVYSMGG